MPSQTTALNLQIPNEELKEFRTILSSIKDSLSDLVQPLKDIRDNLLAAIEPLSTPITPEVDTSGLETTSDVLEAIAVGAGLAAAVLAVIPEPAVTKIIAAVFGLIAAVAAFVSWLLTLDWEYIGTLMSVAWEMFYNTAVTFFTETLPEFFNTEIPKIIEGIITFFQELPGKLLEALIGFHSTFSGWVGSVLEWVAEEVPQIISSIVTFFQSLPGKIWDAIIGFKDTIFNWVSNTIEWVAESVPQIIDSIIGFFSNIAENIGHELGKFAGTIATWVVNAIDWVKTEVPKIINRIINFFKELPSKIAEAIGKVKDKIIQWGKDCIEWFTNELPKVINNVIDWFKKLPNAIKTIGENLIKGLWNGIVGLGTWLWDQISSFFGGLWDIVSGFFGGFGSGFSETYSPVPKYATGGFPTTGQMFIAREAGPELIGTIGGRSAVVNNNQIVEAVSNGVARAVASVMGAGSGGQNIQVFIGNEQLDRYIVRSQRRQALRTNGAYL